MANYDNLYDSLDRNDYTLLPNGVISNKYQGLFYKGKLIPEGHKCLRPHYG